MYVIKRSGRKEKVHFEKIGTRLRRLSWGLSKSVDTDELATKVIAGIYAGVKTTELDELAAETAVARSSVHEDYNKMAARISMSNLHKMTKRSFSEVVKDLHAYIDPDSKENAPLVSDELMDVVSNNKDEIDSAIVYSRDFDFDYFGFKTLERAYLLKLHGAIVERPQHMFMRVALGIHGTNVAQAIETYHLMSKGYFTHASPTLFQAGTRHPGLNSCFLVTMKGDSLDSIFETVRDCAMISKAAGGIGINVHDIRASGTYIKGTGGHSNGIVPMLRVLNNTARYVDQGGGKRKGAFSIYLEPWHADIFGFLDLRKPIGDDTMKAEDLFYALWIPDLFMKRIKQDGMWSLMCPKKCPGLADVYGDEFETLYEAYEKDKRYNRQVKARDLWNEILKTQVQTGNPYMLYKDHVNHKSQQANLGTIRSSNLCVEIVEYSSPDECAVCTLASVALPRFVMGSRHQVGEIPQTRDSLGKRVIHQFKEDGQYDFAALYNVVQVVTRNLNKIIDLSMYPIPEATRSNHRHRPIGIGVQGLADVFQLLNLPYESPEAQRLNRDIFETMYFAALSASCDLAEKDGPYDTFKGSPASEGNLQFDLWGITPNQQRWDWTALKDRIKTHGLRNSLTIALMPTASTSQILGNTESFEPRSSNSYIRRTLAGEFPIINAYMMGDLRKLGLWDDEMRRAILQSNGSLQDIDRVPAHIKKVYKTVWEMSQKTLLEMSAARGAFVDQSQSLNCHLKEYSEKTLNMWHMHGWKLGLKTGMYYLRGKETVSASKTIVDVGHIPEQDQKVDLEDTDSNDGSSPDENWMETEEVQAWRKQRDHEKAKLECSIENKDACVMCSS